MKITEAIELLTEYSELEGTEMSEAWSNLLRLRETDYCLLTEKFKDSLDKEIIAQVQNIKKYAVVEEIDEEKILYKRKVFRWKN